MHKRFKPVILMPLRIPPWLGRGVLESAGANKAIAGVSHDSSDIIWIDGYYSIFVVGKVAADGTADATKT
jgi:hypothetical protein